MTIHTLRRLLCIVGVLHLLPALAASEPSADTEAWQAIRSTLFAGREIVESNTVIELEAPFRADANDAGHAVVPCELPQVPAGQSQQEAERG